MAELRLEWTFGQKLTVLMIFDDCLCINAAVTSSTNTNGTQFESATGTRYLVVIDGWEMHVPYAGPSPVLLTFPASGLSWLLPRSILEFYSTTPNTQTLLKKSNMSHQDHV